MAKTGSKASAFERHGSSDDQLRGDLPQHAAPATAGQSGFSTQPSREGSVRVGQRGPRSPSGRRRDGVPSRQRYSRAVLPRSRPGSGHRTDALRNSALALCARGRPQRRPSISQPLLFQGRRSDVVLFDFRGAFAACSRRSVRLQVSWRDGTRRARNLRRRNDQRRRVARVDELRRRSTSCRL